MVKIRFLGACREVGRSGVIVESEESGDKILLDYGVKSDAKTLYPEHVSGRDLSAIVLSHSHIDHCGGIPSFYISGSVPLYCTKLTYTVSETLFYDMLRISQEYHPFGKSELKKMRNYVRFLPYLKRQKVGKQSWITLYNAGHIPGSAMILVEMDGKKILYTGDFNLTQTQLLAGVDVASIPPINAIITETTYGTTNHSPRKESENQLISKTQEIIDNEGIVLIPAFGVSRSQEILMVLSKNHDSTYPITVDGMARAVIQKYQNFPSMFRDFAEYSAMLNRIHMINQRNKKVERNRAATSSGVVVAPSGMLKGGTARYYAENIIHGTQNGIVLVSYQAEDTPGRVLLDTQKYQLDENQVPIEIQAQVHHLDFSSHSGKDDMIQFIRDLTFIGEKRVFCIHGDEEVLLAFAESLEQSGFKTDCPYSDQKYEL